MFPKGNMSGGDRFGRPTRKYGNSRVRAFSRSWHSLCNSSPLSPFLWMTMPLPGVAENFAFGGGTELPSSDFLDNANYAS